MRSRQKSIRRHLVVVLTTSLIALYSLSACVVYYLMSRALTEQLDAGIVRLAKDFIAETERTVDGGIRSGFHDLELEDFEGSSLGGSYYELRDAAGQSVYRSSSLDEGRTLPYLSTDGDLIAFQWVEFPGHHAVRAVGVSFPLKLEVTNPGDLADAAKLAARTPEQIAFAEHYQADDPQNRAHLVIAADARQRRSTLVILASTLIGTGLILVFVTYFLVRKIVARACLPLVELAVLTEKIGPDDLARRLPIEHLPIELSPLISKFNLFIERLDGAINRERRFSVGMAHELRTPVAELRTLMEVALASLDLPSLGDNSELNRAEIFQTGAEIGERMGKIIEVLTAIYESERRSLELSNEPIRVESLIKAALAALNPNSRARVDLEVESPGEVIFSDPSILRAVAENLIKNALVHSPPGSLIVLSIRREGFTVTNQCHDLTSADLGNLGEPFWQSNAARSNPDQFGLGLTLVDQYLRVLGGQLAFSLERDRFSVRVDVSAGRASAAID